MSVTEALIFEISDDSENCTHNRRFSVEIIVLIVLDSLGGKLQCQSIFGQLIYPDPGRYLHCAGKSTAFIAQLSGGNLLPSEFPPRVGENGQVFTVFKCPHLPEFLDAKSQSRLQLDHFHESLFLVLMVYSYAFSTAAADD